MHPSHLRPLGVGEIVDGAFALYRRHLRALLLISAIPQLPVLLALVLIPWWTVVPGDADARSTLLGDLAGLLVLIIGWVLPQAALTRAGADAYLGRPVAPRQALRAGVRRFLPALGVTLVALLVGLALAIFCIAPGVVAWVILFAVVPIVVLERQGVVQALNRSQELAEGAWGRIFLVQALLLAITILPEVGLVWLVETAGAALVADAQGSAAVASAAGAVQLLASMVTLPLSAIGTTLLYFDQRLRRDPLELEMGSELDAATAAGGAPR